MTAIVHVGREGVAKWAIKHLGDSEVQTPADLGEYVAFGVTIDRKPVAACIFHEYRPMPHGNDLRVIIVATDPNWCKRNVLREIFEHAFVTCNCVRLTAVIREGNERSVKLCAGLGFRKEGVLRKGFNGKTNALVFGMLRSECKWLESRHGQESRERPAAGASIQDGRGAVQGQ